MQLRNACGLTKTARLRLSAFSAVQLLHAFVHLSYASLEATFFFFPFRTSRDSQALQVTSYARTIRDRDNSEGPTTPLRERLRLQIPHLTGQAVQNAPYNALQR